MLSSSSRASPVVSTGVLPFLTTYLGPRTAWAGFTSRTWPVTSQSKSMRRAARCCLTVGGENSPCRSLLKAADMEGLDGGELSDAAGVAPGGEAARGVQVGLAGVVVVDLGGEKLQHAFGGLGSRCEQEGGLKLGRRREDDFSSHGRPHSSVIKDVFHESPEEDPEETTEDFTLTLSKRGERGIGTNEDRRLTPKTSC